MKRELSSQAAAAKCIRTELKAAFPSVKFSVKSNSFAGGDSVHIEWTDGPTTRQVEAIVNKYEYGTFNGMIDLYEYTNVRKDIPQTKYVQTRRDHSDEAEAAMVDVVRQRFGVVMWVERDERYGHQRVMPSQMLRELNDYPNTYVRRELHKLSMLCAACNAATLPGDKFCPACGASLTHEAEAA